MFGGDETAKPLLFIEKLVKEYFCQGATATFGKLFWCKLLVELDVFCVVDGISFFIGYGESVGFVGEFGCGKLIILMMVMRLLDQIFGLIQFDGEDIGVI